MKIFIKISAYLSLFFFVISCEQRSTCNGGEIYNGNFVEEIIIVDTNNSTNIIVEFCDARDTIPYSIGKKSVDSDLVRLNLYISYSSFTKIPLFQKDVYYFQDTLFVWYSTIDKTFSKLKKSNLVVDVGCEPRFEFVKIDSIKVEIGANKIVTLNSKKCY